MQRHSDLFISALHELHDEAPIELLRSLRESLEHIRAHNPQSAQTAEACLAGLASDSSTLLHVLTAAYLINGGVMLKHQVSSEEEGEEKHEKKAESLDFGDLEAEIQRFTLGEELKTEACPPQSQSHPPAH